MRRGQKSEGGLLLPGRVKGIVNMTLGQVVWPITTAGLKEDIAPTPAQIKDMRKKAEEVVADKCGDKAYVLYDAVAFEKNLKKWIYTFVVGTKLSVRK